MPINFSGEDRKLNSSAEGPGPWFPAAIIHIMPAHDDPAVAARAAEAAFDWPEAIRLYEEALSSLPREDDAWPAAEAELLTALGRCYWRNAEARAAWRTLMRAISSCKQRGDAAAQARATTEILQIWGPWERHKMLADDALAALGESEPYLRARLLGQTDRDDEAFAIAEQHGYDDVLAWRIARASWRATDEGRLDEAQALTRQAHEAHDRLGNFEAASGSLRGMGFGLMVSGDLDAGEALVRESYAYAGRFNLRFYQQLALMDVVGAVYARCDWPECERLLAETPGDLDFRADLFRMWIAELRGDAGAARALLVDPQRAGGSPDAAAQIHSGNAGVQYRLGEHGVARAELAAMVENCRAENEDEHYLPAAVDAILALADEDVIAEFDRRIAPAERKRGGAYVYSTLQGRALHYGRGVLALRLGREGEAARWFESGLTWAERERCPLDAAACHEGLAQLATRRGDAETADRHSQEAMALRKNRAPRS
jgi:tetratricopeptide (TPR) repeat protein